MLAGSVPIALVCRFHGMKWGVITSAAEILIVTMIGGPALGLTTAFYTMALGLAMGYGFSHNLAYWKTLHLTVLAYLVEMTYKIVVSIYLMGLSNALEESVEEFVKFIQWIWVPLANVMGFNPDPGQAAYTTAGAVMVLLVFVLNAYCYAYLNVEITSYMIRRLKQSGRY